MSSPSQLSCPHDHTFGQDAKRPGESRTLIVIALTAVTMVVEIWAGIVYGSMALLADGLHMASHAAALTINAFAYVYARKHARDPRFSFGVGKVNVLGGFTGAVLLVLFALLMAGESLERLVSPVEIAFNQAIAVAVLGLVVNGVSVFLLGHHHEKGHDHHHDHEHDHNLRAAYLHVLADALTSFLAIAALLAGKYFGWVRMDPVMGIVGAILVSRWAVGLVRTTSRVLLDRQAPKKAREAVRRAIEGETEDRIVDLHLWAVGPGIWSLAMAVTTDHPREPEHYLERIEEDLSIVHATVEVRRREG